MIRGRKRTVLIDCMDAASAEKVMQDIGRFEVR
jgi:hypothetical protein